MHGITIVADDRVGLLADISYILGTTHINIETISVSVIGGKAVVTLLVKNPEKAEAVLRNSGFLVSSGDVLFVKVADQPGALAEIAKKLADNKINGENLTMITKDGNNGILSIKVDRLRKAKDVLKDCLIENLD
jgi:hypothetical protein